MLDQLTELFKIEFYYWYRRKLGIYLYKRVSKNKTDYTISIWEYHKIKEFIKEYNDHDWYSNWWKNFVVWKNYKGNEIE